VLRKKRPAEEQKPEFDTSIVEAGSSAPVRPDVIVCNKTPASLTVRVARDLQGRTTVEIFMLRESLW